MGKNYLYLSVFDENNRPMFSVPEEILKMFIEENKLNMYIS